MKRTICAWMVVCLAALACFGCAKSGPFTQPNEIVTYTKTDPAKTQIVVSTLGNNSNLRDLAAAFEAANEDVQVIRLDLTGGTAAYRPVVDWVVHGIAPDVMLVNPDTFVNDAQITGYLEDLSANPCIERFEVEALNRLAINGHVYFLPAPSEINCIIYNRTLFERYGWEVPGSFDEFVALCNQIREDTNGEVQPWNPNAIYDLVFSTALEAFTYVDLFSGVDNWAWYHDFCDRKATFAGHMEPFFDMVQTLIDNKILLEEHFSYSATTRGKEFEAGKIAMYNAPISRINSNEYAFDYMPYPSTSGGLGYVNDYFSAMLCVPARERTEAERDAVNRFIAFFSSAEGQRALIGETLMLSNVKDVPLTRPEAMAGIETVIEQGHKFSRLDFPGSSERNWADRESAQNMTSGSVGERSWTFRESALSMVTGEKTGAQIIAEIDRKPYKTAEEAGVGSAQKIAEVAEDFTVLEFSCYIADMYREQAGAEIGLINHGVAYRGNLVRIFAGDMFASYMYPIKPRSFANGSTLVKLSMTGRQILDALNHPVGNESVSNSVYAVSGLKCEIAPWNAPGEKYLSVKRADGAALDPDALYTVACWDGCVAEEYITEVLETFEGTWEERMETKMRTDGTLAPAKDGRIKLVWGK